MSIGPPIPGIQLFQNLTLKIQGQGHGWGQSLKSQHGSNIQSTHIPFVPCQSGIWFLSYDFSKIWPWKSKSGPNLCQIWQIFGPWASPYGANGQMTMTLHNYRPRQFHRTSNGENPVTCGYRDMGSANLAAARPPARTVTTIPLQPGGLRGNESIEILCRK